jgi:hypothetical protein
MPFGDNDDTDPPAEWRRIFWGLLMAGFGAYLAYECFTTGQGTWGSGFRGTPVRGDGAVLLGIHWAFLASFLHFEYFWAYFPRLDFLRRFLSWVSLAGWVLTVVFLVIYTFRHPE